MNKSSNLRNIKKKVCVLLCAARQNLRILTRGIYNKTVSTLVTAKGMAISRVAWESYIVPIQVAECMDLAFK
jgi:hypothetical protein